MATEEDGEDLEARVHQLEVMVDGLRGRVEALEREAGSVEEELHELVDGEDLGVTE